MEWEKIYSSKLCSAEEAVQHIKSNDVVVFGECASEPPTLVDAMVANAGAYRHVRIEHMLSLSEVSYADEKYRDNFYYGGFFCCAGNRESVNSGVGDYLPVNFSEIPKYFKSGMLPVDVCMVLASPPDENGICHICGVGGYTYAATQYAKTLIVQIDKNVPVINGDTGIRVEDIDCIVESDTPIRELTPPAIGAEERTIGDYCASLVEDGSTLQVGFGTIPDAVMEGLRGHRHLGVHTELMTDSLFDLVRSGAVDNSEKAINRGLITTAIVMGTKAAYEQYDHYRNLEIRSVGYVNDPYVVAQNSKMVAINGTLEVDLTGQANSESIGYRQYSGVGGQVDYLRGTSMSRDGLGKSILAMKSTATLKNGKTVSKIVPVVGEGAAVTVNRCDADYIITEYGIARMRCKTLKERGRELIRIAHPDFRDFLERAFYERYHVMP
ncbi:MAG: 4-hydroxybutyrate CoA-transferase [Eubacteriaceae bacterium]|nr:4-hydroxybutyrate CoA-transferase [Eubacteriaceae bacterium]